MYFVLITGLLTSPFAWSEPTSCAECATVSSELAKTERSAAENERLLTENNQALSRAPASEVQRKAKIVSNVLILTTRRETLNNTIVLQKQKLQRLKCASCPK